MPKFQFPHWLEGTPEQQKAESERQAKALAVHTRAKMTEAERLIGRGRLLEETARQNLELSKGKDKEARILAENQLADALAMQGRYAEASEVHNDKHRRKYFRDIIKALEKPDEEKCDCPDTVAEVYQDETGRQRVHEPKSRKREKNGSLMSITPRMERVKVFSPIHNDIVSLVECSKCGHANARPLRSRLLNHGEAVDHNEAIAQGKVKGAMVNDTQILNAGS